MTKLRHNIVKVLWPVHKHEPQASEYWRQFAFYFNKSLEKGAVKKHFAFQKETTNKRTRLRWRNKVLRAVSGNSRDGACFIFFVLDKQTWQRKMWNREDDFSKSIH